MKIILEEYLQPLDDYTYTQLLDSIRERGQQVPITVGYLTDEPDSLFLVDGHNRYKACNQLNIEPVYSTPIEYADLADVKLSMIDINDIRRRKLGADERRQMIRELMEQDLLMSHGGNNKKRKDIVLLLSSAELASRFNTNAKTVQRDVAVIRDENFIKNKLETDVVTCVLTDADVKAKADVIKALESATTESQFVEAVTIARKYLTPHELRFAEIHFNAELAAASREELTIAAARQRQLGRINIAITNIEDMINKAGVDVRAELVKTLIKRLYTTTN
jgi:ParB-like nuclease domain